MFLVSAIYSRLWPDTWIDELGGGNSRLLILSQQAPGAAVNLDRVVLRIGASRLPLPPASLEQVVPALIGRSRHPGSEGIQNLRLQSLLLSLLQSSLG